MNPESTPPVSETAKKNTLLYVIGAIVVLVVVGIYFFNLSQRQAVPLTEISEVTTSTSTSRYIHSKAGYSIELPEDWVAEDMPTDPLSPLSTFTSFKKEGSDGEQTGASFDIMATPRSESEQRFRIKNSRTPTPQDLVDTHIAALKAGIPDFAILENTNKMLGDREAFVFTATWTGGQVTARKYLIFTPATIYTIGMSGLTPLWQFTEPTLVGIAESFRVQ